MNTIKMKQSLLLFLLSLSLLTGCTNQPTVASAPDSVSQDTSSDLTTKELTVAAASSLIKAFSEIGTAFEKANNCTVTFSFGSTGTLSEQIINGAPFDVFAAANEKAIDDLQEKDFILPDTNQIFTVGRIAIANLKDAPIPVKTIEDLLNPEIKKIAIANPELAPYGLAAKQTIKKAGLWDQLETKLVYGKNISETLTFISTGNAEAGFIALSLKDDAPVDFTLIDTNMHEPLSQSIGVVKNTQNEELAKAFSEYVLSEEGQAIMSKYGFSTPGK